MRLSCQLFSNFSRSEKEEVVHVWPLLMQRVWLRPKEIVVCLLEELMALWFRLLLSVSLLVGVFLVKLGPADGARVVLFEPSLDAAAVEGVVARQCAASLTVGALLQADVAVCFFAFLLLR